MSGPDDPRVPPSVLADTTVWIRAFRSKKADEIALKEKLQAGVRGRRVYTCWVVRVELLAGARDEREYEEWLRRLEILPEIESTPSVWRRAAKLSFLLRKKGHLVPLPDILIAAAALEGRCPLWSFDADFDRIAAVSELRIER